MNRKLANVRPAPLARVAAWLDRALTGPPVVGVIRGGAGMGKSVLVDHAARIARDGEIVTATVVGYGPGACSQVGFQIARQLHLQEGGSDADYLRRVRSKLKQLDDERRCAVLLFDDVHLYSPSDMVLLQDLALVPPSHRLAIICAVRSLPTDQLPEQVATFLQRLRMSEGAEWIELQSLSANEARALIESSIPSAAVASRFVRELVTYTSGNPSYLAAIAHQLGLIPSAERFSFLSGSRPVDSLPVPSTVAETIELRLAKAPSAARPLLEIMAVWRFPVTLGLLSELSGEPIEEEEIERNLEALQRAELVVSCGPRSDPQFDLTEPIDRSPLLASLPSLRRRRLHQRAATVLESQPRKSGDARFELARHYLGGSSALDSASIQHVVTTARQQIAQGRYAAAHDLLTELVDRLEEEQSIAAAPVEAFSLLADTFSRSGAWEEANRALARAASTTADSKAHFASLFQVARGHWHSGRELDALAIYRQVLAHERLDPPTRIQALIYVARLEQLSGQPSPATEKLRQALGLAEDIHDEAMIADTRQTHALLLIMQGQPRSALPIALAGYRSARRAGGSPLVPRATMAVGIAMADVYCIDRGIRWIRRALQVAERSEDYSAAAWVSALLAAFYIESGAWSDAQRVIERSLDVDAALHRDRSLRCMHAIRSILRSLQGVDDHLDHSLSPEEAYSAGPAIFVPCYVAQFERAMLAGDLPRAAKSIEEARDLLQSTPGWERYLVAEVLPRQAQVNAAAMRIDAVDEVASKLTALADVGLEVSLLEPEICRANAHAASLRGEYAEAMLLARAASEKFGELGCRWRSAVALSDAGMAAARCRTDQGTAIELLRRAYIQLETMGARGRLDPIRDALRRLGERTPHNGPLQSLLTARQWQVAELASRGMTDRKIAESLGVSHRTVTTHIHNILHALRLTSRGDLRAWIDDHEPARAVALMKVLSD